MVRSLHLFCCDELRVVHTVFTTPTDKQKRACSSVTARWRLCDDTSAPYFDLFALLNVKSPPSFQWTETSFLTKAFIVKHLQQHENSLSFKVTICTLNAARPIFFQLTRPKSLEEEKFSWMVIVRNKNPMCHSLYWWIVVVLHSQFDGRVGISGPDRHWSNQLAWICPKIIKLSMSTSN